METDLDKELRQMQNEKKMFENEANLDKARFVLHLRETLGQEMLADLAEMEKEQIIVLLRVVYLRHIHICGKR